MATICFTGIRFISDDHIPSLRIKEVLEDTTLISVLIIKCVCLNLANRNVGKAPDL